MNVSAESSAGAVKCGVGQAIERRSVTEMVIHSEGNLHDLLRHNTMLDYMIKQLEGGAVDEEPEMNGTVCSGWLGRFDEVTTSTSQALAQQAILMRRLAELTGLDI